MQWQTSSAMRATRCRRPLGDQRPSCCWRLQVCRLPPYSELIAAQLRLWKALQGVARTLQRGPLDLLTLALRAGMRMIESADAERVLLVCRQELADSGFLFREQWAQVISGQDEGVYAWVAANYASGALRSVRRATMHAAALCACSAESR